MTKPPHPMVLQHITEHYTYDPDTGNLYKDGVPAGNKCKGDDYIRLTVCVSSPNYLSLLCNLFAHHVAWYLMYGDWPSNKLIDHIDGDPANNRLNNLRLATATQNNHNTRKRKTKTTSRYKGVSKVSGKWGAYINYDGRSHTIGRYATEEEAALAYNTRAVEVFGEYAKCNIVGDQYMTSGNVGQSEEATDHCSGQVVS